MAAGICWSDDWCVPMLVWYGLLLIPFGFLSWGIHFHSYQLDMRIWWYFCIRYHSSLFSKQKRSCLGKTTLESIRLRTALTQIINWVCKDSLTLTEPPNFNICLVLQFWYPWVGSLLLLSIWILKPCIHLVYQTDTRVHLHVNLCSDFFRDYKLCTNRCVFALRLCVSQVARSKRLPIEGTTTGLLYSCWWSCCCWDTHRPQGIFYLFPLNGRCCSEEKLLTCQVMWKN